MVARQVDPNWGNPWFNLTHVSLICEEETAQTGIDGGMRETYWTAADVASWCETCVRPIDGTVVSGQSASECAGLAFKACRSSWIGRSWSCVAAACHAGPYIREDPGRQQPACSDRSCTHCDTAPIHFHVCLLSVLCRSP